uniref:Uncharacterized protein n=1 Tax=Trichogramma kaykai TaxID=54128 RepID=A0ABD2XL94_9HYME
MYIICNIIHYMYPVACTLYVYRARRFSFEQSTIGVFLISPMLRCAEWNLLMTRNSSLFSSRRALRYCVRSCKLREARREHDAFVYLCQLDRIRSCPRRQEEDIKNLRNSLSPLPSSRSTSSRASQIQSLTSTHEATTKCR